MSIQPVTKRILVCEDSDTIARLWVAALEQSGYQVVGPVSSAEKALEEAYQHLPDL
jgi:CheY-like chemotaxis protein